MQSSEAAVVGRRHASCSAMAILCQLGALALAPLIVVQPLGALALVITTLLNVAGQRPQADQEVDPGDHRVRRRHLHLRHDRRVRRDGAAGHRPAADHDPRAAAGRDRRLQHPVDLAAQARAGALLHRRVRRHLRVRGDAREGRHQAHPGRRLRVADAAVPDRPPCGRGVGAYFVQTAYSVGPARPRDRRAHRHRPDGRRPHRPHRAAGGGDRAVWPALVGFAVAGAIAVYGVISLARNHPQVLSDSQELPIERGSDRGRSDTHPSTGSIRLTEAVAKVWPEPPVHDDESPPTQPLSREPQSDASMTIRPSCMRPLSPGVGAGAGISTCASHRACASSADGRQTDVESAADPAERAAAAFELASQVVALEARREGDAAERERDDGAHDEPCDRVHAGIVPCAGRRDRRSVGSMLEGRWPSWSRQRAHNPTIVGSSPTRPTRERVVRRAAHLTRVTGGALEPQAGPRRPRLRPPRSGEWRGGGQVPPARPRR